MRLSKIVILLGFTMLFTGIANAQTTKKESTAESDVASNANLETAVNLFKKGEFYNAIPYFKKGYAREKDKTAQTAILFSIAECYRYMNDAASAIEWYNKAIKEGTSQNIAFFHLAEAERILGKYDDALTHYRAYQQFVPDDQRAAVGIQSCQFAKEATLKPTKYKIENVEALNSKASDFNVALSHRNSRLMVFTSSRPEAMGNEGDGWTGEKRTDLFETYRDDKGKWSTPKPMAAPINTDMSEGSCFFDRKGGNMFFTRCLPSNKREGTCNIYFSRRSGETWGEPKPIALFGDTITVGHPCLSRDELSLYFSSDMPGGFGGKDIYVSVFNPNTRSWGRPLNLGAKVNTAGDEMFPSVQNDGTLYFSSNGHIGMGGLDLFKTKFIGAKTAGAYMNNLAADDTSSYGDITLTKFEINTSEPVNLSTQGVDSVLYYAQQWDEASNLGIPINSSFDDFGITFENGVGERGYFASNRDGGKGNDDIYSFNMPPLEFTIQGKVMDMDSRIGVKSATVELLGSDGTIVSVKTDKKGAYIFDKSMVKANTVYRVTASSKNFLAAKGVQSTVGLTESTDLFQDAFLLKNTLRPIALQNIYYDVNKATLRAESQIALDSLVQTLIDNPKLAIRVTSHTDSRSSDEYNLKLSQDRAQSVVDYLISHGIDMERLEAKGMGESKPLITDEEVDKLKTAEEKEVAYQKNRRTEFEKVREDYVPKARYFDEQKIDDSATKKAVKVAAPMHSNKETSKAGVQKTAPEPVKAKEELVKPAATEENKKDLQKPTETKDPQTTKTPEQ